MEDTIGYEALFSPDEWDSLDRADWSESPKHTVTIWYPPGESEDTENSYELECDICKLIGATDTLEQAKTMARLHEVLQTTVKTSSDEQVPEPRTSRRHVARIHAGKP